MATKRSQPSNDKQDFIDVRRLVNDLGGRGRIPGALREQGLGEVSEAQVDKWINRNSILSSHLGALLVLAKREGRPLKMYRYVRDGQ